MNKATQAPLMLSISGARGIVGESMTQDVAASFAAAFGSCVRQWSDKRRPIICLGRDSRPSGESLAQAVTTGLASTGCAVIDLGLVTTPTVGVMMNAHRADGGMVVTASHNPGEWNGLKCINHRGAAPPANDVNDVLRRFRERDFVEVDAAQAPAARHDLGGTQAHVDKVLANIDADAVREAKFKVVLDSVNGAGCVAGRMLLERLGCEVVHLNGDPTGVFTHTPEPTEANLGQLIRATGEQDVACGFAQDPDADRLAIVDENGTYIGEEYTLVLAALRVLQRQGPGALATNLSTSRMIDDLATRFAGSSVSRAAVGEANVAAAMMAGNAIVGGEGNGGVIYPPVTWIRDSLSSMALVLSLIAHEKRPLSAIVADLPSYVMIKHKFDLTDLGGRDKVGPMLAKVAGQFADQRVDETDGVRVDFDDGWVHLRPSNTEPIVRLIAESATRDRAWERIDEVASVAGLR